MRRKYRILLLVLLIPLAGCFEYRETVTVDKDGQVEVDILASVIASAMPFLKNRPEYPLLVGIAAGKKALQRLLPGAIIERAQSVKSKGWVTSDLAVRFPSLAALATNGGKLGGEEIKWYENPDGSMTYERTIYKPDMKQIPGDIGRKIADHYWKEARLHFEMTTPLKVRSTNGFMRGDYTIVWDTNMAQVKKMGLRLKATFEPPSMPEKSILLLSGAGVLLLLLLGGLIWKLRHTRKAA